MSPLKCSVVTEYCIEVIKNNHGNISLLKFVLNNLFSLNWFASIFFLCGISHMQHLWEQIYPRLVVPDRDTLMWLIN